MNILQIYTEHSYQYVLEITYLLRWSTKSNWISNCIYLYIKLVDHIIDIEWIVSFDKNNDRCIFHFECCYRNSWKNRRTTFNESWKWHNQYKIMIIRIHMSIGIKIYLLRYGKYLHFIQQVFYINNLFSICIEITQNLCYPSFSSW